MTEVAGATVTVDGITSRPTYSYAPPACFFDGNGIPAGTPVFNVLDYGAVASAAVDNRVAMQAAVDAAASAGGGIVYVPPGTYGMTGAPDKGNGGVYLRENVFMMGAGMGETTLRVMDGWSTGLTGIVRSYPGVEKSNYGLADITLDGNRANTTGKVDAFYCGVTPDKPKSDYDVYVLRVEAMDAKGYGFDPHEVTTRLVIADCVAHGNGLDGFVADHIVDGVYSNNVSYDNDRHGFNIVTTSNDFLMTGNVAHGNGVNGITIQRGSFDVPSPFNVKIEGGEIYGNSGAGIVVRMSSDVLITGVNIHDNGQNGIYLKGSNNVTIDGNTLTNNSASKPSGYPDILIAEEIDSTVAMKTYRSDWELISNNIITASPTSPATYAIEERAGAVGYTVIDSNFTSGHSKGTLKLLATTDVIIQDGTPGNDTLTGAGGDETLDGALGNDSIDAGGGNDSVAGGGGDDTLEGRDRQRQPCRQLGPRQYRGRRRRRRHRGWRGRRHTEGRRGQRQPLGRSGRR